METLGKKLTKNHSWIHKMEGKQLILKIQSSKIAKLLNRFVNKKYNGNFEAFIKDIVAQIWAQVISTEQIEISQDEKSFTAIIQESHAQLILTLTQWKNEIFFDIFTCWEADPFKIKEFLFSRPSLKRSLEKFSNQIITILRGQGLQTIYEENNANHLILDVENCQNTDLLKNPDKLSNILLYIFHQYIKSSLTANFNKQQNQSLSIPTIDIHKFNIENPSEVNLNPEDGGVSVTIDWWNWIIAIHTYPEIWDFMLDIRDFSLTKKKLEQIHNYLQEQFQFERKNILKKIIWKI